MPPRLPPLALVLALLGAPVAVADPAAEVQTALKAFLNEYSYTWGPPGASRGLAEESEDYDTHALMGQHEKGGFTKIYFFAGPHIPSDAPRPTRARVGFTDTEPWISNRWVFETDEGWKTLQQLPAPSLPMRGGPVTRGIFSRSVSVGTSLRSFGTRRPDHEIAALIDGLEGVESLGAGLYCAELTPETVTELVAIPLPPVPVLMPTPSIKNATGSVRFWLRDGALVRYELTVSATRVNRGPSAPFNFKVDRELTNVGSTVVDVPPEVKEKFAR